MPKTSAKLTLVPIALMLCLFLFIPPALADDSEEKTKYDRAMELITSSRGQVQNLDLAMAMAHIMLKENPNSARAYTIMGRATEYAAFTQGPQKDPGMHERATAHFQKAIELDSDFIEPYYFLAIAHVSAREFDQAMQLADTMQKKRPDWPPAHYIPSLVAKKKDDYKQLVQLCLELEKKFPNDRDTAFYVNTNLLFAYEKLSMLDEAEALYLKLLAAEPNNLWNLDSYAAFLNDYRHDYDKAIEYAQKALAIEDYEDGRLTVAMAATNKARSLYQERKLEEAEKYCVLATQTMPQYTQGWVGLTKINYSLGLNNKSMERLQKARDAAIQTKQHGMDDPEWDNFVRQIEADMEKLNNQSQPPQS